MVIDYANPLVQRRKAWQYLPGQRRVKLAPDICCDTPNPGTAGAPRPTTTRSSTTGRRTGSTSSWSASAKC